MMKFWPRSSTAMAPPGESDAKRNDDLDDDIPF
jgi:hypothetical protein